MKHSGLKSIHPYILIVTVLVIILSFLGILLPWQDMVWVQSIRIVAGSIFILFLPGYYLTRVFFRSDEIDGLEQIALSFALSISVVPLVTFYTNLVGLPITALNVAGITTAIITLSILFLLFFPHHRSGHQTDDRDL